MEFSSKTHKEGCHSVTSLEALPTLETMVEILARINAIKSELVSSGKVGVEAYSTRVWGGMHYYVSFWEPLSKEELEKKRVVAERAKERSAKRREDAKRAQLVKDRQEFERLKKKFRATGENV